MAQVFISYSRKDLSFVEQLVTDLEKAGLDVWHDVSSLGGGDRWRVAIEAAIKDSQFVIVVLSPDSMASEWVEREFLFASNLDRKIIPLMYRSCELTLNYLDLNYIDVQDENYVQNIDDILKALSADDAKISVHASEVKQPPFKLKTEYVVAIIVALIGLIGTISAALISARGLGISTAPSQTAIPATAIVFTETPSPTPIPTDTVQPDEPTLTPPPATDTLVPTFTPVPPVAIGKDWIAGCISTLWKTYPSNVPAVDRGDGCWKEPVHVFSAENGDLDFLAERGSGPAEVYGLFAPLPESGIVTFTIRLRELKNVDLLTGIFAQPDVNSPGLLMIMLNGRVDENVFIQKDPPTYVTIQGTQKIKQENGYSITFRFDNLSARSIVNPAVFFTDPLSIPSAQKWLFLGYKALRGSYKIDGTFLNFELK